MFAMRTLQKLNNSQNYKQTRKKKLRHVGIKVYKYQNIIQFLWSHSKCSFLIKSKVYYLFLSAFYLIHLWCRDFYMSPKYKVWILGTYQIQTDKNRFYTLILVKRPSSSISNKAADIVLRWRLQYLKFCFVKV